MNSASETFISWAGEGFFAGCLGFGFYLGKRAWDYFYTARGTPLGSWRQDMAIQLLLREARTVCGADRAFLAQFENGSVYASDREKWRYSWTHEDTDHLTSMAPWRKDISTTLVPDEMKLVEAEGPSFALTSELVDGTFKHMCAEQGTEAITRCSINGRTRPLGFIGLEWETAVARPANLDKLIYYAGRLERIISSQLPSRGAGTVRRVYLDDSEKVS